MSLPNQTPREAILTKIRTALKEHAVEKPFPEVESGDVFVGETVSREEKYAEEFSKLGGKFVYCLDEADMMQQLHALADTMKWPVVHTRDKGLLHYFKENQSNLLQDAGTMDDIQVGVSYCEYLVARTGSAIMSSAQDSGRQLPVYSPIHITVAYAGQVVWDIAEAIQPPLPHQFNYRPQSHRRYRKNLGGRRPRPQRSVRVFDRQAHGKVNAIDSFSFSYSFSFYAASHYFLLEAHQHRSNQPPSRFSWLQGSLLQSRLFPQRLNLSSTFFYRFVSSWDHWDSWDR